jgi:DNA-3-methyladenine glycosylase I
MILIIKKLRRYTTNDRERLLSDSGIIRNKLKVNAAIHNAQRIMELVVAYFKTFGNWLDVHHPLSRERMDTTVQKKLYLYRWRDCK